MVYFAFNSPAMAPSSIKKGAKATFVIGHTDASGSDSYNKALADKRANAVISALRKAGVKGSISMVAAGERDLAVKTKDGMKKGREPPRRDCHPALRKSICGPALCRPANLGKRSKAAESFQPLLILGIFFRKVPDFGMVFRRAHAPWIGSGAFRQHRDGFAEHIPATVHGLNKLRLVLCRFDLFAQARYMNIDRAVMAFHLAPADGLDQFGP